MSGLIPDSRNIFLWGAGLLGFVALMRIFSAVYEKPVDLGVVVTRKRSFFTLRGLETYIPTPWGTKTLYVPILSKWQPVLSGVVDDVLSDSMKQLWKAKGMVARIVLCSAWQTFCGIPFRRIHWYELQAACMCMCAQSVEVPISFWPGNPEVICREVKNVLDIYSESLVDFKDTYPDCKMTKATYNAESHESAH